MDAVSNYQPKNVVVNMHASRLARICAKQSVRERAFFGAGIYLGKVHVRGDCWQYAALTMMVLRPSDERAGVLVL